MTWSQVRWTRFETWINSRQKRSRFNVNWMKFNKNLADTSRERIAKQNLKVPARTILSWKRLIPKWGRNTSNSWGVWVPQHLPIPSLSSLSLSFFLHLLSRLKSHSHPFFLYLLLKWNPFSDSTSSSSSWPHYHSNRNRNNC